MKRLIRYTTLVFLHFAFCILHSSAQGIHFSQYYNAPMLLNPANTALMPDNDYRVGANYRDQWASVPVPYKTFSAYADFGVMRGKSENSWLGLGLSLFNDVAGNGNLSLTKFEGFAAYHVKLGMTSMVSAGLSGGYVQRSVDFSKLTFGLQWDGFSFDGNLPSGEVPGTRKTTYFDVGAGLNYAYFPNENVYIKLGGSIAHLNKPNESFYGMINKMEMRPSGNLDVLLKAGKSLIVNPSVYYTSQRGAYELMYGSLFTIAIGGKYSGENKLLLGAYHRLGDAIVTTAGFEWGNMRLMTSYDITISQLAPYNNRAGAFEVGLRWQGNYSNVNGGSRALRSINCPRFL